MKKLDLNFLTLDSRFKIVLEAESEIDTFAIELISVFQCKINDEQNGIIIETFQKFTGDLKYRLNQYFEKYKERHPKLYKFKKKFDQLQQDEFFCLLPPIELITVEKLQFELELASLNKKSGLTHLDVQSHFLDVIDNYEIFGLAPNKKVPIGEPLKDKRVCRFCKKKQPEVTFKNVAHAISEALGNKKIILHDECDICNAKFDKNIERDLITYFSIYRTYLGIQNKKNSIPKIKGENFEYYQENGMQIIKHYSDEDNSSALPPSIIELKSYDKNSLQNIYKSLCKFTLSVMDNRYVQDCGKTIEWISGTIGVDKLPLVAVIHSFQMYKEEPELTIYHRKNDNDILPYMVGEFHFTFITMVFIIPFTTKDNCDFTITDNYNYFFDTFKHYGDRSNWKYEDFSDTVKRSVTYNLKFNRKK